ncbi:hypothetical protein OH77DRAFT_621833 [Trametes cingulata]|nr:hypothetical protein OH77DRAFT_621833 [Trametes cingulata]
MALVHAFSDRNVMDARGRSEDTERGCSRERSGCPSAIDVVRGARTLNSCVCSTPSALLESVSSAALSAEPSSMVPWYTSPFGCQTVSYAGPASSSRRPVLRRVTGHALVCGAVKSGCNTARRSIAVCSRRSAVCLNEFVSVALTRVPVLQLC